MDPVERVILHFQGSRLSRLSMQLFCALDLPPPRLADVIRPWDLSLSAALTTSSR